MAGKSSKELEAEQIEAWHKAARERSARTTDAEQAQILAAATVSAKHEAQSAATVPVGVKLPPTAKIAAGKPGRVFHGKIQKADIERWEGRPFAVLPWLNEVDERLRQHRGKGDVLATTIRRVAEVIGWGARATEMVQKTFEQLADQVQCCAATAFKAVRWLEEHGLLNVLNALHRVGRDLERGPNFYVPATLDVPAPVEASDAPAVELSWLARAEATLQRLASRFGGLVQRAWGLNATPVASKWRTDPERRTDPPHATLDGQRPDPVPA